MVKRSFVFLCLSLLSFTSVFASEAKVFRQGLHTAIYGKLSSSGHSTPEAAAQDWISHNDSALGVQKPKLLPVRMNTAGELEQFTVIVYQQLIDGLKVEDAFLRLLITNDPDYRVVFASSSLVSPPLAGFSQDRFSPEEARASVQSLPSNASLNQWSSAEKVIVLKTEPGKSPVPVRAWRFRGARKTIADPKSVLFFVDAADKSLVRSTDEIVYSEIQGQVSALATPGTKPDISSNLPVEMALPFASVSYASVTSPTSRTLFSDQDGKFVISPWDNSTAQLEATLNGKWVSVQDFLHKNLSLQALATPLEPVQMLLNQEPSELSTSQVNALIAATKTHDFYKALEPGFAELDQSIQCNVNLFNICNAYFDSSTLSINFFHAGGGCVNSAYSSVVSHEYGHFIVNRLNLAQGSFGEGFADTVALMLYDDAIIGKDFFGPDTFIRNIAAANQQYPCSAEIHTCGQVLAGTWWDLKLELQQSLGKELGEKTAQQLFGDWSQITAGGNGPDSAHPQTALEVLSIDDDDGDLSNGTPHFYEISTAFAKHNIPVPYDCNQNGHLDSKDLLEGISADCNSNGIPDECELSTGDCNKNGILDECEIASGSVQDCNANGVPDSCEGIQPEYGWTKTFIGSQYDESYGIALDANGNIFVGGQFFETIDFGSEESLSYSNGLFDVFVTKLNPDGSYAWSRTFGNSSMDYLSKIAVDGAGNLFATGTFFGSVDFNPTGGGDVHSSNGDYDIYLTKWNADGSYAWTKTFGSEGGDISYDVATDSKDSVIVVGNFEGTLSFGSSNLSYTSNGSTDAFIAKFDANGSILWVKTFGGSLSDQALSVAVDPNDNVLTVGQFMNSVDFDAFGRGDIQQSNGSSDVFVMKLHSDGSYIWTKTFGGSDWETPKRIAVDKENNVVVAGGFFNTVDFAPGPQVDEHTSNGGMDTFATKFYADGSYAWTKTYGGSLESYMPSDYLRGVQIDSEGNVLLFGQYYDLVDFDPGPGEDIHYLSAYDLVYDAYLMKLKPDGSYVWTQFFHGQHTLGGSGIFDVATSPSGEIFTTGLFEGEVNFNPISGQKDIRQSVGYTDVFITKLSPPDALYYADCNSNGTFDGCDIQEGRSSDNNKNQIPDECESTNCVWDLDHDGKVGTSDLGILLGQWGLNPAGAPDFNGNGIVDASDLALLLSYFGDCP